VFVALSFLLGSLTVRASMRWSSPSRTLAAARRRFLRERNRLP
jgi:hypothetical protein